MQDSSDFILKLLLFTAIHSFFAIPSLQVHIRAFFNIPAHLYRFSYNILSIALFSWVMLAWRSTSIIYIAPGIMILIMYGLQLLLLLFMFICIRQTGIASFIGINSRSKTEASLSITGCYALVRHPLYLSGILFLLLNPVMTGRWMVLTIISSIYMIIGAIIEERRLLEQFGTKYNDYRHKVPFIIPGIKRRDKIPA